MKEYSTSQRRLLLDFLKSHVGQFTVEEICMELCAKHEISESAVYRNIAKLLEEGLLKRFAKEGGRGFLYQFMECGDCCGLHLKCTGCGKIFHVDGETSKRIFSSMLQFSSFSVDGRKTVIYGKCSSCR